MVSAGNTGATMASALLRMGRLPGVVRPCIATPLPRLGRTPAVLVDAGANAECTPAMLVQFAQMGAAYVAARFGTASPSVGLLSIGEEPTKGTPLVKETHGPAGRGGRHRRLRVPGQPGGPGPAPLAGRRDRDRRLHRQRDPQDAGGVVALPLRHPARRLRDRRRDQGGVGHAPAPSPPAGRRVRTREHRGGHAPRHRRDLRHQPRILECNRHDERRPAWPTSVQPGGWPTTWRRRSGPWEKPENPRSGAG